MKRTLALLALIGLTIAGCSNGETPKSSRSIAPSGTDASSVITSTQPTQDHMLSDTDRVTQAETAVLDELSDAPIWKGLTVKGGVINESEICVDRTYGPDGSVERRGKNAGYVIVSFPEVMLGDPQDGLCKSYVPVEAKAQNAVDVPADVASDPGLLVSTSLGDKWPLTVPYVVVNCEEISVAGRLMQVATVNDPDGKTYSANGTAKDHGDYLDIDPIWAPNPNVSGIKIDLSPITDAALERCNR